MPPSELISLIGGAQTGKDCHEITQNCNFSSNLQSWEDLRRRCWDRFPVPQRL